MMSCVIPRNGLKLDEFSAVIGRSWEKSTAVGVPLKRGSMEGKVDTAVGEGAIIVEGGVEVGVSC